MSFTQNSLPIIYPGAYMMNRFNTGMTTDFPIYSNLSNYSTYDINERDDYYLVLPKFKLVVYTGINYNSGTTTETSITFDNSGTKIKMYQMYQLSPTISPNTGSSCKLYYNDIEIQQVYATDTQ